MHILFITKNNIGSSYRLFLVYLYVLNNLSAVAKNGAAIRDEQEVNRRRDDNELSGGRSGVFRIGRVVGANKRAGIAQIELSRARNIDVRRRLIRSGIQAEIDHQGSLVFRSNNVVTTKCVWLVVAEELGLEVLVDANTVRLNVQCGNSLADLGVDDTTSLSNSCGNVISGGEVSRGQRSRIRITNSPRRNRSGSRVADTINVAAESVPVAPFVGVTRGNREAVANSRLLVKLRANTGEDGLNRPLQLREQNVAGFSGDVLHLLTVNADQRETNALDIDVVNFGVHEDVVDVELKSLDVLGANSRFLNNNRLNGLELAVRVQLSGSLKTLVRADRVEDFSGETQEEVAGRNVNQAGLFRERDCDEALAVRDRNRGNRETSVLVEPEEQRNPHIKSGLGGLGCLRANTHVLKLTRAQAGVDRRNRRGGTTNSGNQSHVVSTEDRGALNRAQVRIALNRDFLTDQTLPAGELAGRNLELLVQVGGLILVVIERVTVNLELDLLEETLTGVLAITNKVLVDVSGAVNNSAVGLYVRIGEALVHTVNGISSFRLAGRKISSANVGGERGNVAGRPVRGAHGLKLGVNNHVIKEITELRDRILNSRTICGATRLCADLVIFISNGREWLKMRIDKQDVSALYVDERRCGVRTGVGGRTHAHNVLNALVEQFCGHDHAIGLAVVGNEFENTSCRHSI